MLEMSVAGLVPCSDYDPDHGAPINIAGVLVGGCVGKVSNRA